MNDPHVEWLKYRVLTAESITYKDAEPLDVDDWPAFRLKLADGVATATMRVHFPSVEAARPIVEAYLRAWEIVVDLDLGPGNLAFAYDDGHVVDRAPPPPSPLNVSLSYAASVAGVVMDARVESTLARPRYPDPPIGFQPTPIVEAMWRHYKEHREGREQLAAMAYYCVTELERAIGTRDDIARECRIHKRVLSKLGWLSSQVGDTETRRKRGKRRSREDNFRKHTEREEEWMRAAVAMLIRRAGELGGNREALPQITMNDLPPLDEQAM